MAELVDALASGASGISTVQVQVLPRAPLPDFFLKFRANALPAEPTKNIRSLVLISQYSILEIFCN